MRNQPSPLVLTEEKHLTETTSVWFTKTGYCTDSFYFSHNVTEFIKSNIIQSRQAFHGKACSCQCLTDLLRDARSLARLLRRMRCQTSSRHSHV